MAPEKTVSEVNDILHTLRGKHFRHARNVLGKPAVSSSALLSHQPSLPFNLIYPTHTSETVTPFSVPGPRPPRSWRSPTDSPAWRERALSLLLVTPLDNAPPSRPIPQLTLLCLQLIRATCPGTDLADVVPFIPPHLRRVLLRYTAVHAPLSQIELDALCEGTTHVDTELLLVGPYNALRAGTFRRHAHTIDSSLKRTDDDDSWDADEAQSQDSDPLTLRSLAVLSSPLSATIMLTFPPTITHLVLINIPHQIPLPRLPTICPLIVLLDLSYNVWLQLRGPPILEQVEWGKLRRLEVLGLRECPVTPKLLLELNRGRWESVRVIR